MFGWMVRLGLLPPEVYALGIATKPEAEYTYEEAVKRLDLPEPQKVGCHVLGWRCGCADGGQNGCSDVFGVEYTCEEAVKRLDLPEPQKVRCGWAVPRGCGVGSL